MMFALRYGLLAALCSVPAWAEEPARLIEVKLSPCAIPALDPKAASLKASDAAQCLRLNRATLKMRKKAFKAMRLRPGKHIFRVTNVDVPWTVDFMIQGARDASLPSARGGRIMRGQTFDYAVDLKAGVYVLGSPGTPTPEYPVLVEN